MMDDNNDNANEDNLKKIEIDEEKNDKN